MKHLLSFRRMGLLFFLLAGWGLSSFFFAGWGLSSLFA